MLFLVLSWVGLLLTNRFVKRWLPAPWLASRTAVRLVALALALGAAQLITAWGFDPAVIQINLRQTLDPLRWVNWVLGAFVVGASQAFFVESLRGSSARSNEVPTREQATGLF